MAEREHAIFEAANSIETPLGIDDSLGALALGECIGREFGEEFGREALVGGEIFSGHDDHAGGQAVAQRVQAGFVFAGFGARTGGLQGVAAVGVYLDWV